MQGSNLRKVIEEFAFMNFDFALVSLNFKAFLAYSGLPCPGALALKWVPLKMSNSIPGYKIVNILLIIKWLV